jgi:hypothetical protein
LFPVILVVYDGQRDKAYWLSVQDYFADQPTPDFFAAGDWINVHIPVSQSVSRRAIREIARQKNSLQDQYERKVHRHA